jgi:hypothetical protein
MGPQFLPRLAHVAGVQREVASGTVDNPASLMVTPVPASLKPVTLSGYVTQYGSQGLSVHVVGAPRLWVRIVELETFTDERSLKFRTHWPHLPLEQTLTPLPQMVWPWSFSTTLPQIRCAPSASHGHPGEAWLAQAFAASGVPVGSGWSPPSSGESDARLEQPKPVMHSVTSARMQNQGWQDLMRLMTAMFITGC